MHRTVRRLSTALLATVALLGAGQAASAAVPRDTSAAVPRETSVAVPQDKPAVLTTWTQTSAASYGAWNSARQNQAAWAAYDFDWSTDFCSVSPDNPLGFNFELSCHRHDFGYRNYKEAGQFTANKNRLDDAFHEDMKRRCDTYSVAQRPACRAVALLYYQAVKRFGSVIVDQADIDRISQHHRHAGLTG